MKVKKKTKLIVSILLIMIIVLASCGGYFYWKLNKIQTIDFNYSDSEVGINTTTLPDTKNKITNVLLLGADKQEKATDTMIVLSIDETNNKLKLTSLMRDTYIYFGEGMSNKLNYAYHYGGPLLTVKTINENFNLDIRDYVLVDFDGLSNVIDALGGVEINVLPEEIRYLNGGEAASGVKIPVTHSGKQILNGNQALGYCRIRKVGNVDYQRTERQRTVLMQLLNKMKDTSVLQLPKYIDALAGCAETSISKGEMISLADTILSYSKNGVEESRVPYDGYRHDSTDANGWYYMQWDKEENVKLLHEFIYGK